MEAFALLLMELDAATGTLDKRGALEAYFQQAPAEDAAWAVHFLSGGRIARVASSTELRLWLGEALALPSWLIDDSYAAVGDLAETLALLHPQTTEALSLGSLSTVVHQLQALRGKDPEERRGAVLRAWAMASSESRWCYNKLLTGALRVGVAEGVLRQALSQISGIPLARLARRMMGDWQPSVERYQRLMDPACADGDDDQPYPFFLATGLEASGASGDPDALEQVMGSAEHWQLEWKWDGIRAQLLRRSGACYVYSRGEQRLDGRFPEVEQAAKALPDGVVLDGELLGWESGHVLPFQRLQPRIQTRKPSARALAQCPVRLLAYDLLELDGIDLRSQPLRVRRARLQALVERLADARIQVSPELPCQSWRDAAVWRGRAAEIGAEGLMLKHRDSPYRSGRVRGEWWKWKLDPLTVDAVLIYSQAGHGRRAGLHTDHTFALWQDGKLLPIAKAYSGLSDAEMRELDQWIRAHTRERFGPVRSVHPVQVFELAFEAVQLSARHKSGVAVRFPRMLRWRRDKSASDAGQLADLRALASAAPATLRSLDQASDLDASVIAAVAPAAPAA